MTFKEKKYHQIVSTPYKLDSFLKVFSRFF
jgi:hypothetical protein